MQHPARYFVFDDKAKLQAIGAERPWIDPADIGTMDLVYYTARDGRRTPALLTHAAGWKEGDPAGKAIVLPHGGPWSRDYAGWDASGWIPFLSSRGFAVLQPQYRGSTDWGLDQWRAGDGQFGYKAQDDLEDSAAWLVSSGIAESDKIAIFGYSYGGYAAMAATVRPNSPFQCAIAGAGYAESAKILVGVDRSRFGRAAYASALSGRDVIKDVSQASIPVLVFHGDRDVRVPITFGQSFYNAVKKHTTSLTACRGHLTSNACHWTRSSPICTKIAACADFSDPTQACCARPSMAGRTATSFEKDGALSARRRHASDAEADFLSR